MIYLDNAATSFPKPQEVVQEMTTCITEYCANPGRGGHSMALRSAGIIYDTRVLLAKLFHIENPMQIVFTKNATESINIALKGILVEGDHVITSSMEHNSVMRPIKHLEKKGISHTIVQCDTQGQICIQDIEQAITSKTKLIVITHASNVTGTLMPIEEIGELAKKHGLLFMVDASQTAGVYPIDVQQACIDLLAFPGHKGLLGPQGIGGLYVSEAVTVQTLLEGGTGSHSELLEQPLALPERLESGTLNTPGIAGLYGALQFIDRIGIDQIRKTEQQHIDFLLGKMKNIPHLVLYGPSDSSKQTGIISFNFKDVESSEVSYVLSEGYGIATRSGLHCAPLAHQTIGTKGIGTVRISPGYFTTEEELNKLIDALYDISKELDS